MFTDPFSFSGRIRTSEYDLTHIFYLTSVFIITYIPELKGEYIYVRLISDLFFIYFLLVLGTKRCHDLGQSGWYQLIPFYFIYLVFAEGHRRTNSNGHDPKLTPSSV
jgi:uncharacterized membrane protein YhaH (DUF805 family)